MAVLVTGATGLVGSHVVDLLIARGESVRALVRVGEAADRLREQGVEVCPGDMTDRASLAAAVDGVERVVHCAARTGPWGPRAEFEATNVQGLVHLLALSFEAGVQRFVHVSSVIVVGADVGGVADESSPMRVERHNPYSSSKVEAERVVSRIMRDGKVPVAIVRPGLVYGPRDTGSFGRFAGMIQSGHMVQIGSGANHLPLVFVTDVAQGILLASDADRSVGQIYNLVNDEPVTQRDYFDAIARNLGSAVRMIHVPYSLALVAAETVELAYRVAGRQRPPPVTRYGVQLLGGENRISIRKARLELGFSPRVGLAQGVRLSADWFREAKGMSSADRSFESD